MTKATYGIEFVLARGFRRVRVHQQVTATVAGTGNHLQPQTRNEEKAEKANKKRGEVIYSQSLPLVAYFLPQGYSSKTSTNSTHNWGPSV